MNDQQIEQEIQAKGLTAPRVTPVDLEQAARAFVDRPFGHAIEHLRMGGKVARFGWNGKGMWLAMQVPDADSKMTEPYVYMRTAHGGMIPWLASQADVLANDWYSVD